MYSVMPRDTEEVVRNIVQVGSVAYESRNFSLDSSYFSEPCDSV